MINNLILYVKRHGLLSLYRIPSRVSLKIVDIINTYSYRLTVKSMGVNCSIQFGVRMENPKQVVIGDGVIIKRGTTFVAENQTGILILQDGVQINNNVWIDHTGNVTIGMGSLISDGAKVYSHSHGHDPRSIPEAIDKNIGKNVWLGLNTVVLESCPYVGDFSVIAAGALVTKAVPEYTLCGGVPAKHIKRLGSSV
jgi:acetyltransferase-like isoleucine patch superfamily enzyme